MVDNDRNESMDIPRKLSFISTISEDQTNAAGKIGVVSMDALKTSSTDIKKIPSNETIPNFSIAKIYKNLFILSASFVLLFTAYNGMVTLQSSLNVKNNVGVNSLIITYAFLVVSLLR